MDSEALGSPPRVGANLDLEAAGLAQQHFKSPEVGIAAVAKVRHRLGAEQSRAAAALRHANEQTRASLSERIDSLRRQQDALRDKQDGLRAQQDELRDQQEKLREAQEAAGEQVSTEFTHLLERAIADGTAKLEG